MVRGKGRLACGIQGTTQKRNQPPKDHAGSALVGIAAKAAPTDHPVFTPPACYWCQRTVSASLAVAASLWTIHEEEVLSVPENCIASVWVAHTDNFLSHSLGLSVDSASCKIKRTIPDT
jgi:hypothetical protein